MIDQETRKLALQTFRDILNAPDSKAADRLRAAEGVLKLEQDEKDKGLSDVLDASDAELLERARGGRPKPSNGGEGPANGPPDPDDPAQ
jgi:hypothetical protein